jgi:hypothetical protein
MDRRGLNSVDGDGDWSERERDGDDFLYLLNK